MAPWLSKMNRASRVLSKWTSRSFNSLQQQEDLAAIRDGIADMEAGRVVTLDELDAGISARRKTTLK
jgi:predicted transcriptional regulator